MDRHRYTSIHLSMYLSLSLYKDIYVFTHSSVWSQTLMNTEMFIEIFPPFQEKNGVCQAGFFCLASPRKFILERSGKGMAPLSTKRSSKYFYSVYIQFCFLCLADRKERKKKKNLKKGNFHHESCSKGLQETNLDAGLL